MQVADAFELSNKFNMLMILDCPTLDSQTYSKISEELIQNSQEIAMIFLDTELPLNFVKAVQQNMAKGSNNNLLVQDNRGQTSLPTNIISTYDISYAWLLIGVFSAQTNKQVRIFTDLPENFKSKLQIEGKLKTNITLHKCIDIQNFSLEQAQNPWNQFDNQEALTNFEIQQLTIILKKFIKQIVTSKSPNNLEKLLNISSNLVKAHMSSIQKEKYKVTSDLTFHFIRSLFLDNVLENGIITNSILTNQIQSISDFENFTKINYTPRFQLIIEKIKAQIQLKQQKQAQLQSQMNVESPEQPIEEKKVEEDQTEQEEVIIKQSIQTLLEQYLNLFQKAKIFEIKKLHKLVKQIANYVQGFIMKKDTAPKSSKDKAIATVLQSNHKLICVNVLRVITRLNLIRMIDQHQIDHDIQRVNLLLHDQHQRQLKDVDFLLDKDQAIQIYEQPLLVFNKEKEEVKPEPEVLIKDPVDQQIDKLSVQMKNSKHFPNSLRELERLIKKHIVKKGESQQDEDKTVESLLKRMYDKGMITQKTRTGESKEHAKDPKLKNANILELYKREKKEDIPIVWESSFAHPKQQQQQQQ